MTLSDIASFVTTKMQDTDATSVAACKTFANRAYQMLWENCLWTDTLGVATKDVVAGADTVTLDGVPTITFYHSVVAPTTFIDFPVAVKFTESGQTDGSDVAGWDWMHFFQLDPNAWVDVQSRRSDPTGFIPIPRDGSGYYRFKPTPTPSSAGTFYVLGKLKWVQLGDTDTPALRGSDNVILARTEAYMLERARQYGKAQAKHAEAAALESTMRDLERGQQQIISTIIPLDEGIYNPTPTQ